MSPTDKTVRAAANVAGQLLAVLASLEQNPKPGERERADMLDIVRRACSLPEVSCALVGFWLRVQGEPAPVKPSDDGQHELDVLNRYVDAITARLDAADASGPSIH